MSNNNKEKYSSRVLKKLGYGALLVFIFAGGTMEGKTTRSTSSTFHSNLKISEVSSSSSPIIRF